MSCKFKLCPTFRTPGGFLGFCVTLKQPRCCPLCRTTASSSRPKRLFRRPAVPWPWGRVMLCVCSCKAYACLKQTRKCWAIWHEMTDKSQRGSERFSSALGASTAECLNRPGAVGCGAQLHAGQHCERWPGEVHITVPEEC